MFPKKTIKNIDLKDKTVLLRADYNVPLEDNGEIADDYRIRQSIATLQSLLDQNCKVVIISHLGRPEGRISPKYSLKPVAERLGQLLQTEVQFVDQTVGDKAQQAVNSLEYGQLLMLENLRFNPGEEHNDPEFAKKLAGLTEVFVQDGFGVVHRTHASTEAITRFLPSVAGLLLELEVASIKRAVSHPRKPLSAIVGGVKIATKIDLLSNFVDKAQTLIVGGAMANTFLAAKGYSVGKSLYDTEEIDQAKSIIERCEQQGTELVLPLQDIGVTDRAEPDAQRRDLPTDQIEDTDMILDLGPQSVKTVLEILEKSGTIIWNGPVGMVELPAFRAGSTAIANLLAETHEDSIIGGGDTAAFIDELGLIDKFRHVSTGGGAALELMAGKPLPGVEALLDK